MPLSPLSPAVFCTPLDSVATAVASARSAGSPTLAVASAAGMGAPSSSAPLRVTCYRGPDPTQVGSYARVHLKVTGASGNTLTVTPVDGYADIDLRVGDLVMLNVAAGSLADIHAAVLGVTAGVNAIVPVANAIPAGGSVGQVLAKSTSSDYATAWTTVAPGNAVSSVAGRTGAIVLGEDDVAGLAADLAALGTGLAGKSPLAGSSSITILGTVGAGTWQGSVIAPAYLGTGTRDGTRFLRDDGTFQAVAGASGGLAAANNLSDLASASTARTNLGLGGVDNTADAAKPVSAATATALALKAADSAVVHLTGNETVAGTKTFSSPIAGSVTGNAATATALAGTLSSGTLLGGQGSGVPATVAVGAGLSLVGGTLAVNGSAGSSYGLTYDGATDQATALQAVLDAAGVSGPRLVRPAATPGGSLYLNASVAIKNNGVTLDLADCPITFGPSARLRIQGELAELPTTNKPKLASAIAAGDTVISVALGTSGITFAAGDKIVIRGQNDATGNTTSKETAYLASAAAPSGGSQSLTLTLPAQNDYSIDYAPDSWSASSSNTLPGHDYTYVTRVVNSAAAGDVASGSESITVANGSLFAVGDDVFIGDQEITSSGNAVHNEMNRVVGVSGNVLTFESPVYHDLTAANKAGVSKVVACVGSHVLNGRTTYGAADGGTGSQYPYSTVYARECSIRNCRVDYATIAGVNYGPYAMGYRLEFSSKCEVVSSVYRGKPDAEIYPSGKGYGFVLHGSTHCRLLGCESVNARHGVLIQFGAAGNEVADHLDIDSRISGIDFHGINAVKNHVHDCRIVGGPLSTSDAVSHRGVKVGNTTHYKGDHFNTIENVEIHYQGYTEAGSSANGDGIEILTPSSGNLIRRVRVQGADHGFTMGLNSGATSAVSSNNRLEDCEFAACTSGTLSVDGDATYRVISGLTFVGCRSVGNSTHFRPANVTGLVIDLCEVVRPVAVSGEYAIWPSGCPSARVTRNMLSGANRGMKTTGSAGIQFLDNFATNLLESQYFVDGGTSNNYVVAGTDTTGTTSPSVTLGSSTGGTITPKVGAPLASPAFTGVPTAPTATVGTNTTQIATTAFVLANAGSGGGSGTVTSVALTVPSGLSVSGSPVTGSGTLAITTTLSGVLKGTGSGFAAATAGTDYLAPGGSGAALTGITESQVTGLVADLAAKAPSAGSTSIVTLGVVAAGTWQATAIAQAYLPAPGTSSGTYADGGVVAGHTSSIATNTTAIAARLVAASNLSDLASASTARTNLGVGTTATTASVLKGDGSGNAVAATVGTDYLAPSGSGAALTSLNASNVSSGTLSAARLPGQMPNAYTTDWPAAHGFVEWNYDPVAATAGTIQVAGTAYAARLIANVGGTVNNITIALTSGGTSIQSGQAFAALYDASGNRLGITADQSTAWTSSGTKTMAMGASATLTAGSYYYVLLLVWGTGTMPTPIRTASSASAYNAGLTTTTNRFSVAGSSLTAVPTTFTPSGTTGSGSIAFWCALS